MTTQGMDWERTARLFPRPAGSRPARSVTYRWGSDTYQAVIGHRRTRRARRAGLRRATERRERPSGNTVIGIIATPKAVEIWSREPPDGWPNPSVLALDSVLGIDYLDIHGVIADAPFSGRGSTCGGERVFED